MHYIDAIWTAPERDKAVEDELIRELRKLGRGDILVVVGGVIPPQDHEYLYEAGVAGIYGPGTPVPDAARQIMCVLTGSLVGGRP